MSLDTVLQIGKVLRKSENSLKYYKYVAPCPLDKDGNWPICITIPVKEDFSFDIEAIKITPENQRKDLYYFKFKTSDSDGLVKYIYGDIYYEKKANIKNNGKIEISEGGYYRLANPNHSNAAYRPSSFYRGMNDYNDIIIFNDGSANVIQQFHEQFEKNIELIEGILEFAPAFSEFIENNENGSILDLLNSPRDLKLKTIKQILKSTSKSNLKKLGLPNELTECNEDQQYLILDLNNSSIFIHFDFPRKKHWYMYENDMKLLNTKVLSEFVDNTSKGLVLKKTLYKTLCSGDKKNDIQFPFFTSLNKYKSKSFNNNELHDLFYAIDYTSNGIHIPGTDLKLIVLPCGNNLTAEDYETFLEKKDENRITESNRSDNQDDILFKFSLDDNKNITFFDLIFCKKGGLTSPDSDLIEISGIEKSKLKLIMERISKIAKEIELERKKFLKTEKDLFPLKIDYSFRSIFGNPQYDEKKKKVSFKPNSKYQSHLLKVLPLIYTENYYQDEALLPAFIQNVEFSIRSGDQRYGFLKYDLEFLLKIQNTQTNKLKAMVESISYQIGLKLGKLAKPLRKKINSFEKRYVGFLTRHISTKYDCVKFANDINEMLSRHEKTWGTMSAEVCNQLANISLSEYDREKLALGFFEGYFNYEATDKRKTFFSRLEKLISDYEGNPDLENEVEVINNALSQINQ